VSADYTGRYEMIVGLEVHAELRTQSKMFCSCGASYGAPPNTHVCPICLGHPGTLPRLNRHAVELAIRAGLVLDCEIMPYSRFDRQNYFYPDLPKGYQITQYRHPICLRGALRIETEAGETQIRITRIHLEEDAGKLIHDGAETKIDCNRCGVPLIEIVSEPDIRSSAEAKAYLSALRERLVYADVSDCRMNEGSMRCDVNLSVRRRGETGFGTRTEIKNINSIAFAGRAIDYEFARQAAILEEGGEILPQTRRYDEAGDCTVLMRAKESAADYRYFPEPDLPPLHITEADVDRARTALPVLPDIRRALYCREYGITSEMAHQLTESPRIAEYFEEAADGTRYAKHAANLLVGEILPKCGENGTLPPASVLASVAEMAGARRISAASARKLLTLCADGRDPAECARSMRMLMITDPGEIAAFVRKAVEENPEAARQLAAGNQKAAQVLMGAVMRASRGCADPQAAADEIERQCGARNGDTTERNL